MLLSAQVRVARRFQKSVRIDADLGKAAAMEGFVCPQSSKNVLLTMARHVTETQQGAFTWTGPYGSGKSSLAVALAALLRGDADSQKAASKAFGPGFVKQVQTALPTGSKGWRVLPVVARRDDPVTVIGEGLVSAGFVPKPANPGWTEDALLARLGCLAAKQPKTHGGLVLLIDEMGKFLEGAASKGADIYILQQLAEAASRSEGRLLVIGVLHQAFEEYGNRLSHQMRDEWTKIQGRFVDLVVNAAGEEQLDLIARATESKLKPKQLTKPAQTIAELVRGGRENGTNAKQFAAMLDACWPLHPVTACLLGPISRRRFGQNQRSVFGFLNSAEPCGFRDFLNGNEVGALYSPDMLWDYLRLNLEPSILASPDGHRWALAAESLERCEALTDDPLHLRLFKTIAVIDLFKEKSGLAASPEALRSCFPDVPARTLDAALAQLGKWSFTIYKKFLSAHAIFAGSDFDIEQAVREALDDLGEIDFNELKSLAGLQPILAKRHYHHTGTLRWFDVNLLPVNRVGQYAAEASLDGGAIGEFLLAVPTEGETEEQIEAICQTAARHSSDTRGDLMVGVAKQSRAIMPLARELYALQRVSNDHSELVGDPVARREVAARVTATQAALETELQDAFSSAKWHRKYHTQTRRLDQEALNAVASELADKRYSKSPCLHSELLNREKPSTSAITAQNKLLHAMILNAGQPRLGITGFPAEGGLFASLLETTGLYAPDGDTWRFAFPGKHGNDPHGLAPLWTAAMDHITCHSKRTVPISEIFDLWSRPPYGVKGGIMPVLAVSFMLSLRDKVSVYREGIFRAKFDDVDVDLLAKNPATIQLRWMDLTDTARALLSSMAETVRDLDPTNELEHLAPIDVGCGLVSIYDGLPNWTKRTMRLSSNALQIRSLFKKAQDPNKFLFDDIPQTFGAEAALSNKDGIGRVVKSVREGLAELQLAYPAMLHRLRDTVLAELQVPNLSPQALAELRERAENIAKLAGDFRLDAFIGRLAQFDGTDEGFEGIASLAANKPPKDWTDPDIDKTALDLAEMAQRFVRAESFARVKGRKDKRQAMAIVVGIDGPPVPLLEEFDVTDADRRAIDELVARVDTALGKAHTTPPNIILAAFAQLSSRYMQQMNGSTAEGRVLA